MESSTGHSGAGESPSAALATQASAKATGAQLPPQSKRQAREQRNKANAKIKKADSVLHSVLRLASSLSSTYSQPSDVDSQDWFAPHDLFELPHEPTESSSLPVTPSEGLENGGNVDDMVIEVPPFGPATSPVVSPLAKCQATDMDVDPASFPFAECDSDEVVEFHQPSDDDDDHTLSGVSNATLAAQLNSAVRVGLYFQAQFKYQLDSRKAQFSQVSSQKSALQNTTQQCEQQRAQIAELQKSLQSLGQTHKKLAQDYEKVGAELVHAQTANPAQINSFRSGMEYWRTEATKLKDALFAARTQAEQLTKTHASSQDQFTAIENQLRSELHQAEERHGTLQSSLETETAASLQLKTVAGRMTGERDRLKASLGLERERSLQLSQEVEVLKGLLFSGANTLEQLSRSHSEIDQQRVQLRKELDISRQAESTDSAMRQTLVRERNEALASVTTLRETHAQEIQVLNADLASVTQRQHAAMARNLSLTTEVDGLKEEKRRSSTELVTLKESHQTTIASLEKHASDKAVTLQATVKEQSDRNTVLLSEVQTAKEDKTLSSARIQTLSSEIDALKAEKQSLHDSLGSLEETHQTVIAHLTQRLTDTTSSLDSMAKEHAEVASLGSSLLSELGWSTDAGQSMSASLLAFQNSRLSEIKACEEKLPMLTSAVDDLTQKLDAASSLHASLSSDLKAAVDTTAVLAASISSKEIELAAEKERAAIQSSSRESEKRQFSSKITGLAKDIDALHSEKRIWDQRRLELEKGVEGLRSETTRLQAENAQQQTDYQRALDEIRSQRQSMQEAITDLEQKLVAVTRDKKSMEGEVIRLEGVNASLTSEQESLTRGRERNQADIQRIKTTLDGQTQLVVTLQEQKSRLQAEVCSITRDKTTLQSEMAKIDRSSGELRTASKQQKGIVQGLKTAVQQKEEEVEEVRCQVAKCNDTIRALEKLQQEEKARHVAVVKNLEKEVATAVESGKTFQALHAQAVVDGEKVNTWLAKMNNENVRLQKMEKESERTLREEQTRVRGLEEDKGRLHEEIAKHLETIKASSADAARLKELETERARNLAKTQSDLEEVRERRKKATDLLEEAVDRCEKRDSDLVALREVLADVTRERETLLSKLGDLAKEQTALLKGSEDRILSLQQARDTLFSQLKLQQTKTSSTQSANLQLSTDIASLQTKLSNTLTEKTQLVLSHDAVSRHNEKLEEERSKLAEVNAEMCSILSLSLRTPLDESQLATSKLSIHDLRTRFEQELQSYRNEISRLDHDNAELQISKVSLGSRLDELNETCLKITARLNSAQDDRSYLVKAHGTVKSRFEGDILCLTKENQALTQSLNELVRERDSIGRMFDGEHEVYVETKKKLSEQVAALNQENVRLGKKADELDAQLKALMVQTTSAKAAEKQLKDQLCAEKGKAAEMEIRRLEFETAKNRAEATACELQETMRLEMEQLRSQISRVQSCLDKERLEKAALLKQTSSAPREVKELASLQAISDGLREDKSRLRLAVDQLASEKRSVTEQLSSLTTKFDSLSSSFENLSREKTQSEKRLGILTAEKSNVQSVLAAVEEAVQKLKKAREVEFSHNTKVLGDKDRVIREMSARMGSELEALKVTNMDLVTEMDLLRQKFTSATPSTSAASSATLRKQKKIVAPPPSVSSPATSSHIPKDILSVPPPRKQKEKEKVVPVKSEEVSRPASSCDDLVEEKYASLASLLEGPVTLGPVSASAPVRLLLRSTKSTGHLAEASTPSLRHVASSSRLATPSAEASSSSSKPKQKTPAKPLATAKVRALSKKDSGSTTSKSTTSNALKRRASELDEDSDDRDEPAPSRASSSKKDGSRSSGHRRPATPKKKSRIKH